MNKIHHGLFVFIFVCATLVWQIQPAFAQFVAVYPVETNGFSLGDSEVKEISRLALQACYDVGLKCAGRGETLDSVQKEQALAGTGRVTPAQYVAEFTLTGITRDKIRVGIGGVDVGGGYVHHAGAGHIGVGIFTDLSQLGIDMNEMSLTCQISRASDGTLAFSRTQNKLHLRGGFLVGEFATSNTKKLLKEFRRMFSTFKKKYYSISQ